jgi:hypothetical protein
MGKLGGCCCACDCLTVGELPTISISGWTGGSWSGSCCYEQTFTPNTTPAWTKSCSGTLYDATAEEECVTEHWRVLGSLWRGFGIDSCDDIPDDYCCPPGREKIATTTTNWTWEDNAFLAVWRRPYQIIVRVSQEEVDCEGVEGQTGGCKIVIRSRYVYEWASKIYKNSNSTIDQTVTMHNTTCFEVNDDYVITSTPPTETTCDDVPSDPANGGFGSLNNTCAFFGNFYFDRVKYYDDMPTGSVEFTNSDVPGCDSSLCDYSPYAYVNQACVYGPTEPVQTANCAFQEPCYCTGTISEVSATITQGVAICQDDSPYALSGCNTCNPPAPSNCTTDFCAPIGPYTCPDSGYSMYRLGFTNSDAGTQSCLVPGVGSDGIRQATFIACGQNRSLEGIGGILPPYSRLHTCTVEDCNSSCCEYIDDCPCCVEEQCKPIYSSEYYSTVITHTRSQTCSGLTSASVCTNAPTWTITLS